MGALVSIVLHWLGRRRPELKISVRGTGGGASQVDFTARVSNVGTKAALNCVVTAELDDIGVVFRSQPFNLGAGELDRPIRFALERPRYGTLVKELNNELTLYGRALRVRVAAGRRKDTAVFREKHYDPVTNRARHGVQQALWRTPPA